MSGVYDEGRRRFLKISGAAAAAGMTGSWSFKARADLGSVNAGFFHFTDTLFTSGDDKGRSGLVHGGYMIGETYALADDLVEQAVSMNGGSDFLLVHSGNLLRSGKKGQLEKARFWLSGLNAMPRLTVGEDDCSVALKKEKFVAELSGFGFNKAASYYSYLHQGVRFIHLDASEVVPLTGEGRFADRERQLKWLLHELGKESHVPAVLVLHAPPLEAQGIEKSALAESDRLELLKILNDHPRVVLVLAGGALKNRAEHIGNTNALCLVTCSPSAYPCGCRRLELEARGNKVEVRSRFIQTRLLHLAEKSFY
ncbi:MAG: twin-arginine translocation signal domain-containing protein, partial [bacterium]